MFVWSARVLFSLLQSLFGHHDWTDKHVVVTAETVNTNTDNTHSLLSYRRASRCFNQNTHTKEDSGTKSETLGIKNSL